MTLIDTFGSPENAYIAAGMLRSHGIKCEVIENAGSELFPAPLGGIGETSLYVDSLKAEQALQLLRKH